MKWKVCRILTKENLSSGAQILFLPHFFYLATRMSDDEMEYANFKQPKVMHCIVFGNIVLSKLC